MEHRKIDPRLGPVQAAADGFAAVAHARHQVFRVGHDVDHLVHHHDFMGLRRGSPPHIGGAEELRMQSAAMQCDPHHRKAGGIKPPREFVEHLRRRRNLPGRADQPCRNPFKRVMARPLGYRPLVDTRGQNALAFAQLRPARLRRENLRFRAHGLLAHGLQLGVACRPDQGGPPRGRRVPHYTITKTRRSVRARAPVRRRAANP